MRKRILAVAGSTRKNSVNELILRRIATEYADTLDVEVFTGLAELPHFNPDLVEEDVPMVVKTFQQRITRSDGVIICTPEYVFSLPASLKNALEWTVSTTVFLGKPVGLIVASGLGEKTFESLQLIMTTLGARIAPRAALLIQGARAKLNAQHQRFDEQTVSDIRMVVNALIEDIETTSVT